MPKIFWTDVWNEGQIRFHQKSYNPQMVEFFKDIDLSNKSVFIPLAGKSLDILFFKEKGAQVFAVEFVESAIIDFFKENNLSFKKINNTYFADNITFYHQDFFEHRSNTSYDVIYDRASQVVFDKKQRPNYYAHLQKFLHDDTILLIFSVDHSGPDTYGPPFKITEEEIKKHYAKVGIELYLFQSRSAPASDKAKEHGINEIETLVLSSLPKEALAT